MKVSQAKYFRLKQERDSVEFAICFLLRYETNKIVKFAQLPNVIKYLRMILHQLDRTLDNCLIKGVDL